MTSEKMAAWIKENNLIKIVLRDSLHQPQYVEKLEKILRFVIKESQPKQTGEGKIVVYRTYLPKWWPCGSTELLIPYLHVPVTTGTMTQRRLWLN